MFGCILELLETIVYWNSYYKGVFKAWLGNELVIATDDADDAISILNNRDMLEKADIFYKHLRHVTGEGLLTSQGTLNTSQTQLTL